jgi:2'-hydroxyisoflavone reductase
VIDVCAYYPRQVEALLKALKGRIVQYILVSSISVYADFGEPDKDESDPLHAPIDGAEEKFTSETYGPFKAMCERSALDWGPSATLLVRPGIIVGPHDNTGRFNYWVQRVAGGGELLAPGSPGAPLQVIDVRDLAAWMVERTEAKTHGRFNTIGPRSPLTWGAMFETAAAALGVRVNPTWVDDAFIAEHKAAERSQLPLYLPPEFPSMRNLFRVSGRAAFETGLSLRPLAETVVDTLHWLQGPLASDARKVGLTPDLEAQLLAAWSGPRLG